MAKEHTSLFSLFRSWNQILVLQSLASAAECCNPLRQLELRRPQRGHTVRPEPGEEGPEQPEMDIPGTPHLPKLNLSSCRSTELHFPVQIGMKGELLNFLNL